MMPFRSEICAILERWKGRPIFMGELMLVWAPKRAQIILQHYSDPDNLSR
jgi:hypothetical protein